MSQEVAASLRRTQDLAYTDGAGEALPEGLANQFGWAKVPTDPFSTRPAAGAVV